MATIISMDNGTTGSFCILDNKGKLLTFEHIPTLKEKSWRKEEPPKKKTNKRKTKKKSPVNHYTVIDIDKLQRTLAVYSATHSDLVAYIERPAVSFMSKFGMHTALSAFGAYICVAYVMRKLQIPYYWVDSKEWQEYTIPEAMAKYKEQKKNKVKTTLRNKDLKVASNKLAKQLFPEVILKEDGDGDCLCMGYYFYQKLNG